MTLAMNIVVGATLAGDFNGTIGTVVAGLGRIDTAALALRGSLWELGEAWASLHVIGAAVGQASTFEHQLTQTAIAAGLTGGETAKLKDQLRGLAVPERTNQSMQDLLKGYTALVSAGVDKDKAGTMLEGLGRTATATQAGMEDLGKAAAALTGALGVPPEGMGTALDQLAFAGKQGTVDLKDMAKVFPSLGAAAKGMGLQGTEAVATLGAALQIAAKEGVSPTEAANNMRAFLAKAASPETVKAFAAHGVNLRTVLSDAVAKGENPMDALLQSVQSVTGGDAFKLGELFGDQQSLAFLKPMLAGMEEYKTLKASIAGSSGTVDADFARMMETNKELVKGFNIQLENLGLAVGSALLPPFNAVLQAVTPVATVLGNLANAFPATTAAVVAVGAVFTLLPPVIATATAAWTVFSASMLASPLGLVIGAIAIGAGLIIDNWGAVKAFFSTIWNGVAEHWRTILAFTGPLGWAAIAVVNHWGAVKAFFSTIWNGVVEVAAPVGKALSGIFTGAWDAITKLWNDGVANIMALWNKVSGPLKALGDFLGLSGGPAEVPTPGAALPPANDNAGASPAANDNRVNPGAGLAAAETRGAQALARAPAPDAAGLAAPASALAQRVEVELILPPGLNAAVRGTTPGVTVIARTGQSMVGGN